MDWSFSISGERGSCLTQLDDNLGKAAKMESSLGEEDIVADYFDNISKQFRPLIEAAPDNAHLSASLSGDAHSGKFSCSYNQPGQTTKKR